MLRRELGARTQSVQAPRGRLGVCLGVRLSAAQDSARAAGSSQQQSKHFSTALFIRKSRYLFGLAPYQKLHRIRNPTEFYASLASY